MLIVEDNLEFFWRQRGPNTGEIEEVTWFEEEPLAGGVEPITNIRVKENSDSSVLCRKDLTTVPYRKFQHAALSEVNPLMMTQAPSVNIYGSG